MRPPDQQSCARQLGRATGTFEQELGAQGGIDHDPRRSAANGSAPEGEHDDPEDRERGRQPEDGPDLREKIRGDHTHRETRQQASGYAHRRCDDLRGAPAKATIELALALLAAAVVSRGVLRAERHSAACTVGNKLTITEPTACRYLESSRQASSMSRKSPVDSRLLDDAARRAFSI